MTIRHPLEPRPARLEDDSLDPFHTVFFHANAGMAISLPDGAFTQVNPSLCRMLGYAREEMEEMSVFDITHPDDLDRTRSFYEEVSTGKRDQFTYEKRFMRKDGSFIWGITTAAWILDSEGAPLYCVGMIQDITRFKEKQEALLAREKI